MIALMEKMTATPQWAEACKNRDWTPIPLFGDEYKAFLERRRRASKASSRNSGSPDMASGGAQEHHAARVRPAIGETIIGVGVLALAIVMAWQAWSMPVSPIYAKVGPTVFPIITALALGMLGILLLVDAVRGGWQPAEEKEVTPDRAALLWSSPGWSPTFC